MTQQPATHNPQVIIAEGAIDQLDQLLAGLSAQRLFFVIDKPAYQFSGAREAMQACLGKREVTWFDEFELNPKIEDVERGVAMFRAAKPDVVMALGGGSALDIAKLIDACGAQEGAPLDYVLGNQPLANKPQPLIVIPTTSGTGSEATHFAVVYVGGKKFSMADAALLPDHVLIDPKLTWSLPARTTAACGLDALSQCIESAWAVGATDESIEYSCKGLRLALEHIEAAVGKPDPAARRGMAEAAYLSGKAINISKTTAAHAMSYAVTTHYHVPHGSAVALTLGAFLLFNSEVDAATCTDPRGVDAVKARIARIVDLLGGGSVAAAHARLQAIVSNIGSPMRLRDVGITSADLPGLIAQVNVERLSNNPRKITVQQMQSLLDSVL
jgi:alcohol dehydrogenase class IV